MTLLNALVVSSIFTAGAYLLLQRELVRTVLGIALISNSATLFIIASGLRRGGPPIYPLGERVADPLVQSLALQNEARSFDGPLTAFYDGKRIPLEDAASIPASLRGYVQYALDLGLINARFAVAQGPYDLQPTLKAYFDPSTKVTRAAYAVAAGRYMTYYQSAED